MMNHNRNNKRFLKSFLAGMVIVILICLMHVSGTLAQWSPYNNIGWASQPFFGSSFFSFNPISSYTGSFDSGFSSPYSNYPSPIAYLSPGLLSLELELYDNYSYNDIFSPYSSFKSSGSFFGPPFSSFNSSGAASPLYPEPVYVDQSNNDAVYAGSIGNNPYYLGIYSSAFIHNTSSPYTINLSWYSPWISPPSFLPPFILSSFGNGDNHLQIDNTKENSLPHSMKGYELYSWRIENDWYFTLITGTNRLKSYAEITSDEDIIEDGWVKITVRDIDSVKTILGQLPKSEEVFWINDRWLEQVHGETGDFIFPDIEIVDEIKLHCMQLGIELNVKEETVDFIPSGMWLVDEIKIY